MAEVNNVTSTGTSKSCVRELTSGATSFLQLSDTPNTYSGQGSKIVAVNSGGTALEFIVAGSGTGTGDVIGPASSTDNAVARFNSTTGKIIQNSTVTIDDSGNISTTGTIDGRDISTDGIKLDTIATGAEVNTVDSVNSQTGAVVLDADDISDAATTNKYTTAGDISKLAGIEAGADVTDATNVNAAGAVMNSDYTPAHSLLVQQSGTGSPSSLAVSNNSFIGKQTGNIASLSATTARTILNVEDGAEVNTIDTIADTAEIDLTISSRQLTASIVAGSIDESKLDTSVNASLDLADSAIQAGDNVSDLTNDSGFLASVDIGDINTTGTADSTTFLRGDGAWATPAGGGGGGDAQYDATAFTSQTSVTVTHNFDAYPVVNVIDNTGAQIIPLSVTHASVNAFTVTFSASTTGTILSTSGGASVAAVFTNVVNNYTKTQYFGTTTLADGATINWDLDSNQVTKVTLGGNRTMAAPTNLKDGATYILRVIQDGTGSRTITWNAAFKWAGGTAPTLSTAANAIDIVTFTSDGTNLYGVAQLNFS